MHVINFRKLTTAYQNGLHTFISLDHLKFTNKVIELVIAYAFPILICTSNTKIKIMKLTSFKIYSSFKGISLKRQESSTKAELEAEIGSTLRHASYQQGGCKLKGVS